MSTFRAYGLTGFIAMLALSMFVSVQEGVPKNAKVYVFGREYWSPPCFEQAYPELLREGLGRAMTIAEARAIAEPNDTCRNADGFNGASWSVLRQLAASLGVVSLPDSRWKPDGSWNW